MFQENRRYFSDDGRELYVCHRNRGEMLRAECGFSFPANYKIRKDFRGVEFITAKGHTFYANR